MKRQFLATALLFLLPFLVLAQSDRKTAGKKTADIAAIKQMCGCFEVTFEFSETFASDTAYSFQKNYHATGLEWVELVEESSDKLVLQHLLLVNDSTTIKHWRQDWLYENTALLRYDRDLRWQKVRLPKNAVKGQWTQKVYQVDDSPRYEGTATWVHVDGRHFWENTTDAPLPRREFTKRSDYNVLRRGNRHEITREGWVHEQNNDKVVRSETGDHLLAQERGWNPYIRVPDSRCQPARNWWTQNAGIWAEVRKAWDQTIRESTGSLELLSKVDGKSLWQHLDSVSKEQIPTVLSKFVVHPHEGSSMR